MDRSSIRPGLDPRRVWGLTGSDYRIPRGHSTRGHPSARTVPSSSDDPHGATTQDAITALRHGRELARDEGTTGRAIDLATARYRELSKLSVPIPRIFRLSSPWILRLPSEGRSLPELYYDRQFFAASAALWSAFFATDLKLADDMTAQNRYNAAWSAALAAAGYDFDEPPLDDQAKARWRRQALKWLKADLAYWAQQAESDAPGAKAWIAQTLKHWTEDPDLEGIRALEAVNQLADDEQKACRALWKEVDQLLKKTGR